MYTFIKIIENTHPDIAFCMAERVGEEPKQFPIPKDLVGDEAAIVEHLNTHYAVTQEEADAFNQARNEEYDAVRYKDERSYPSVGEQLDMLFHEVKATGGISSTGEWASAIQAVKDSVPKPTE